MRALLLWLILVASAAPTASQGLPIASTESVGLSSRRGKRDIEASAPMQKDTIYGIASMSKAITLTVPVKPRRAAGGTQ